MRRLWSSAAPLLGNLLAMVLVRRKMAGKPAVHISGKAVGAVLLGVGMCMAMVWSMLVPGIVMGVAGILLAEYTPRPQAVRG